MGNENTYIIPTSILITHSAFIAQSGERQTEDLVVAGSIPAEGIPFGYFLLFFPNTGTYQIFFLQLSYS